MNVVIRLEERIDGQLFGRGEVEGVVPFGAEMVLDWLAGFGVCVFADGAGAGTGGRGEIFLSSGLTLGT